MNKLKLTDTQKKHFQNASNELKHAQQQLTLAQGFANKAANHMDSIIEMLLEPHGLNPKDFAPGSPMKLDDEGFLIIGEKGKDIKATDRIKADLKKSIVNKKTSKLKVV